MAEVEPNENLKVSRLKALVRAVFFALICFGVLAGSYFLERTNVVIEDVAPGEIVFSESEAKLPDSGYVVSDKANVSDILKLNKIDGSGYVFDLKEGRIWGNFSNSVSKINMKVGEKIVVIPLFSSFDLSYKDGILDLSVFEGNTYIGFLADGAKQSGYINEYDPSFGNVLLVPVGVKVEIPLKKVDERVFKLLQSKLAKEFGYSFIPESSYKDSFVKKNLSKGIKFSEVLKEEKKDEFSDGVSVSFSQFDKIGEKIAVFEDKKNDYNYKELNSYIYSALSAQSQGEIDTALNEFKLSCSDLCDADFFEKWLIDLFVFESSDPEFKVFLFLVDQSREFFDRPYLLSLFTASYERGMDEKGAAGFAYSAIYSELEKVFGTIKDEALYRKFLSYYNQIFQNFLLKYNILYKVDYFEMKAALEKELFSTYYGGQLKDEQKQEFVSEKISFLKRLKRFFFDGKVDLEDAKKVTRFLIESIDDYMPSKTSQNAVVGLFENELNDVGDFWGYINNAEYSKSSLYGQTHKERYEVYLEERDQLVTIIDVQKDILGGDVVATDTPADVKNNIETIFWEIGAKDVKVEDIADVHDRFVKVAAVLNGYVFNAEYDRENNSVRGVYAYGENLTDSSVKLSLLAEFLAKNLEDVVSESDVKEGAASETNAQKIVKTLIAKKISENGFNAGMGSVDVLDPVNAVYRLNEVSTQGSGIKVSFDYFANNEIVKNVFVFKDKDGVALTGEFPLVDLKGIVEDEHLE